MTMCDNHTHDPFAGLQDEWIVSDREPSSTHVEKIGGVEIPGYTETCPKCRGTGRFGRVSTYGPLCFKCKGTGKLTFKTAPEARQRSRASAAARAQRTQAENIIAFGKAHPAEALWLGNSQSDFAASLSAAIGKYGRLTENQLAAVRKCIARDEDKASGAAVWIKAHPEEHAWLVREAAAGNEFAGDLLDGQWGLKGRGFLSDGQLAAVRRNLNDAPSAEASSLLDISTLKGYYAVPDGDTRLKLCVRHPGKNSRYHGWIFVDDGAAYGSRRTYGKQAPGKHYSGAVQAALEAVLKDPKAAQIAYGKLTGVCGVCGRMLEDEQSVAAGIGPICASKL